MNIIKISIDVLFIILIGYSFGELFLFHKSYSLLKKLGLSYALGFGFIGLQMFFYQLINIGWSTFTISLPWCLLILIYLKNKGFRINYENVRRYFWEQGFTRLEKALMALIFLIVFFVGIESVIRPVQAWDGWDNWVLRSNVFYLNNGIDRYYFNYTTDSYPLIIPLTVAYGYISLGKIDDTAILLFYYMFYVSLGALFYSVAKDRGGRKLALLFTFLLLSTQNFVRHGGRYEVGQADLAVGFYIFAGTVVLLDYLKYKSKRTLLLLAILLGVAGQIKNDSLPFIILVLAILSFRMVRDKKYSRILLLSPLPLIMLPWEIFKKVNQLHPNFLFRNGVELHLDRLPSVIIALSKEFINIQNWNLLWIIFIFCLIAFRKNLRHHWLIPTIIGFQWFFYACVFLIIAPDPISQINSVENKLYLHIAPLAVLTIVIICVNLFKKTKGASKKY